jgi:glycosyltransferase involved in cell wall biosynthesis
LITVVTSTLNASDALPYTIASLRRQIGCNFEWIVVDGASTDGTIELLEDNEDLIDLWVSEPDGGIYDAWNKACAEAQGEWLLFIGAGDEIAAPDVLATMARHLAKVAPGRLLVYGKVQYLSPVGRQPLDVVGEPWEAMRGRWELGRPALPPHAAVFHRRTLISGSAPFNPALRIAGDARLLLGAVLRDAPEFVPMLVDKMPIGGTSFRLDNALQMAREIDEINREYGLHPPFFHGLLQRFELLGKVILSRFVSQRLQCRVADAYRAILGKPKRWTID